LELILALFCSFLFFILGSYFPLTHKAKVFSKFKNIKLRNLPKNKVKQEIIEMVEETKFGPTKCDLISEDKLSEALKMLTNLQSLNLCSSQIKGEKLSVKMHLYQSLKIIR